MYLQSNVQVQKKPCECLVLNLQYLQHTSRGSEEHLSPNGFSRIHGFLLVLERLVIVDLHPASVVTFGYVIIL